MIEHKYEITTINDNEGWIYINDAADDLCFEEPDSFIHLVRLFKERFGGTVAETGDVQYIVSGMPMRLVFQWDDLFGIIIIVDKPEDINQALELIKTVLRIENS